MVQIAYYNNITSLIFEKITPKMHEQSQQSQQQQQKYQNSVPSPRSPNTKKSPSPQPSQSQQPLQDDKNAANPKKKQKKKKTSSNLIANLIDTQYPIIKKVVKNMLGMKVIRDTNQEWDLYWTDNAVSSEQVAKMKPYQKINHFPGMYTLSRKNYLARNLIKMEKKFPNDYNFFPKTWVLPSELNQFRNFMESDPNAIVIAKPEASSQGRGIFLSRSIDDFQFGEHYVVQKYLKKPFLIDGLKFDLRVYVLVAGCDPLRVYVYKQGLARFATQPYCIPKKQNLDNLFMHLTNYAINKNSQKFQFNTSPTQMHKGHKRSLSSILSKLQQLGHAPGPIWSQIKDCIAKTLLSAQPLLAHHFRSSQPNNHANNICFEILGFDIILDHLLRPEILEVNYTPSFTTDTPLDQEIKGKLICEALVLMNMTAKAKKDIVSQKKKEMKERTLTGKNFYQRQMRQMLVEKAQNARNIWEDKNQGNYQRILPVLIQLPKKTQIKLELPSQTPQQPDNYTQQFQQLSQPHQSLPSIPTEPNPQPLPNQSGSQSSSKPSPELLLLQQKYKKFLDYSNECYQNHTGANIRRNTKVQGKGQGQVSQGQGLSVIGQENQQYSAYNPSNNNYNGSLIKQKQKTQTINVNKPSTHGSQAVKYTNTENLQKIYKSKFRPMIYKKTNHASLSRKIGNRQQILGMNRMQSNEIQKQKQKDPPKQKQKQKQQLKSKTPNPYTSTYSGFAGSNTKNKNTTAHNNNNYNATMSKTQKQLEPYQYEQRTKKPSTVKPKIREEHVRQYLNTNVNINMKVGTADTGNGNGNKRRTPSALKKGLSTVYNITFEQKDKRE